MIVALLSCVSAPQPGVLVVVVDTMRGDLAGAEWPAWTSEGARVYSDAWAASPWTGTSTVALLTGDPAPWMANHATGRGDLPAVEGSCWLAPGELVTDNWWAREAAWAACGVRYGRMVPGGYARSPADRSLTVVDEARARIAGGTDRLVVQPLGPHLPLGDFTRADGEADPAEWQARYQAASLDALDGVRPLIEAQVAAGWLVILTSDHGEDFGEAGCWEHDSCLSDGQLRIPLRVWGPGVVPGIDDTPVPATCIAQTVRGIGCDLRTGHIAGDVVAGMLIDGEWQERRPGGGA